MGLLDVAWASWYRQEEILDTDVQVATLLGVLLLAASIPTGRAQSEAGGVPSQCYSNAISSSDLLLNYTRSQTSAATTFSFLVSC